MKNEYIEGWPNYVVFEDGDVVNIKTGRVLKPGDNGAGSLHVLLSDGPGKRKTIQVRKLVADAFLKPRPSNSHVITHIDGDYTNCHANNLEWISRPNLHWRTFSMATGNNPYERRIEIIETGEVFENIFECAKAIDGEAKYIHRTTRNSNWEYKGLHFRYI